MEKTHGSLMGYHEKIYERTYQQREKIFEFKRRRETIVPRSPYLAKIKVIK
jgi:hypothetical protein